jgi:hypothetical protein
LAEVAQRRQVLGRRAAEVCSDAVDRGVQAQALEHVDDTRIAQDQQAAEVALGCRDRRENDIDVNDVIHRKAIHCYVLQKLRRRRHLD